MIRALAFCMPAFGTFIPLGLDIHALCAGSGMYFIVLSTQERTVARAMHLVR